MKILVSWLRDFVPVEVGVQELADALTMRGFEVSEIAPAPARVTAHADGAGDDAVLDLEITTNRPDCLSVRGIAREVATIYGHDLPSPAAPPAAGPTRLDGLTVTLEDDERCPRYVASVADVTVGPSPAWLAARLEAAGVRSVNNVVDATNYVMLELGHPMHAFDLATLDGGELRIRRARAGESIRTLDGEERRLDPEMLVIADGARPQALAGVMGGADSEVTSGTRVVALESAYFKPTSIRRTSKRVALSTDASYRFERGADIEAPLVAMHRLRELLAQVGGGAPRDGIIDAYPEPRAAAIVELRHARIRRVLGVDVDSAFVAPTLTRLGFDVVAAGDGVWHATVPSHRVDVSREIDLIEEVARHYGYDRIPSSFPAMRQAPAATADWLRRHRLLRHVLTAAGCSEAVTYSFIEQEAAEPFLSSPDQLVRIANPLSEKFAVLRPSTLPGVIDSVIRNRRREHRDVRLFEIGKRFQADAGETTSLGIAMTGAGAAEHWSTTGRDVDLFDIKGIVERVCDAAGVSATAEPVACSFLAPGRAAQVIGHRSDGATETVGWLGQLAPAIATARGFPDTGDEIYVAEIDVAALVRVSVDRRAMRAAPVPRHPSIVRDLAIVVDTTLHARAVRDTIRAAATDTLVSVLEFDRYEGKGVPEGRVSLAFRLTFRAPDRTLTDGEVQQTVEAIMSALERAHGATLRT